MRHVFIIGSKGIPARYGGFETFVDKLTEYHTGESITYHVSCKVPWNEHKKNFIYHNAECFNIRVPNMGAMQAVYYDVAAFEYCLAYIKKHNIQGAIVYVLACRIGYAIHSLKARLKKLGGYLYINPDGHEWQRAKWNRLVKQYWRISERKMVKHADLLVCDSVSIDQYIRENYRKYHPETIYIAYGAEIVHPDPEMDAMLEKWFQENGVTPGEYYLVVGRFVPENNYETMLREFMKTKTKKKFVLIANLEQNRFYQELREKTHFDTDSRIQFVGTVYDTELLKGIRTHACGYIHGHEVGGTNPSLLEALGATDVNLLLDVCFNREVALDSAIYWTKKEGSLAAAIEEAESMTNEKREWFSEKAKKRIQEAFSWEHIAAEYEAIFRESGQSESVCAESRGKTER